MALWTLVLTSAVVAAGQLLTGTATRWSGPGLIGVSVLLPLTRPEGIPLGVLVMVTTLVLGTRTGNNNALRWARRALVALALTTAAVTLWRLTYFGHPVPNTFYAKARSSTIESLAVGLRYAGEALASPDVAMVMALAAVATAVRPGVLGRWQPVRSWLLLSWVTVAGAAGLYIILGGDHFAGHRFVVPLLPLLTITAVLGLSRVLPALDLDGLRRRGDLSGNEVARLGALVFAWVAAAVLSTSVFVGQTGPIMAHEYVVARQTRALGAFLTELPGNPKVAVIGAGGVRMTYAGPILDVVGLNSAAMAHAPHATASRPAGHSGFNREVFDASEVDIVLPAQGPCDQTAFDTAWPRLVVDDLFVDPRFRASHTFVCTTGWTYYARNGSPWAG